MTTNRLCEIIRDRQIVALVFRGKVYLEGSKDAITEPLLNTLAHHEKEIVRRGGIFGQPAKP